MAAGVSDSFGDCEAAELALICTDFAIWLPTPVLSVENIMGLSTRSIKRALRVRFTRCDSSPNRVFAHSAAMTRILVASGMVMRRWSTKLTRSSTAASRFVCCLIACENAEFSWRNSSNGVLNSWRRHWVTMPVASESFRKTSSGVDVARTSSMTLRISGLMWIGFSA